MKKIREGYKVTEVGEMPIEWEVKKLEEVFELCQYGISNSLSDEGKYPVLRMNNIRNGKAILHDLKFVDLDENEFNKYCLNRNDILFNRTNSIDLVGKTGIYDSEELATFASYLIRIKTDSKIADSKFVNYYMNSNKGQERIRVFATLGVSQANINADNLKKVLIPVPLLKEQQKISLILSSVDEQIEITSNLMEKTKELKKGLMQKLLTKGIGHSRFKDTEIGRIPEEWKVRKLGDIAEYINGKAFKPSDWSKEGLPIVRIQNLNGSDEYNYCNKQVEEKYYIKNDELLFSWSGSRGTSFGPFIWKGNKAVLNQHIFRVELDEDLNKDYCYFALKKITQDIEENAHGSAGLVHITKGELEKFKIPIPKELEQKKIASILSAVDEQIDQYESKKENLQELKKGLMQKLLTGKIRVKQG